MLKCEVAPTRLRYVMMYFAQRVTRIISTNSPAVSRWLEERIRRTKRGYLLYKNLTGGREMGDSGLLADVGRETRLLTDNRTRKGGR